MTVVVGPLLMHVLKCEYYVANELQHPLLCQNTILSQNILYWFIVSSWSLGGLGGLGGGGRLSVWSLILSLSHFACLFHHIISLVTGGAECIRISVETHYSYTLC